MKVMFDVDGKWVIDFSQEITRGVALLDELDPAWYDQVNLDTLRLDNPDQCVLGQLAMKTLKARVDAYYGDELARANYYQVVEYLDGTEQIEDSDGVQCGFSITLLDLYALLTRAGVKAPNPMIIGDMSTLDVFYKKIWEMLTLQWVSAIEICRVQDRLAVEDLALAGGPES